METVWSAVLWGFFLGALNGAAARYALYKALDKADKVFYAVFAAGFFWRLIFLTAAVWLLRDKKYIILLPFAGVLIFTQFVFEAVPLKKNGPEIHT